MTVKLYVLQAIMKTPRSHDEIMKAVPGNKTFLQIDSAIRELCKEGKAKCLAELPDGLHKNHTDKFIFRGVLP